MTALAVVGLACAMILVAQGGASPTDVTQDQYDVLQAKYDSLNAEVDSLQTELAEGDFGFSPCWRDNNPRRYYFTYDVTFQDGWFSVTPHEHWDPGTELRRVIPQSLVNVLEAFPQGEVTGEQLGSFGERVVRALQETGYSANCQLAVTLNDGGRNETDILNTAGFYPVWR